VEKRKKGRFTNVLGEGVPSFFGRGGPITIGGKQPEKSVQSLKDVFSKEGRRMGGDTERMPGKERKRVGCTGRDSALIQEGYSVGRKGGWSLF